MRWPQMFENMDITIALGYQHKHQIVKSHLEWIKVHRIMLWLMHLGIVNPHEV